VKKRSICRNAYYIWKKWEEINESRDDRSFFRIVDEVDITLPNEEFQKSVDRIVEDFRVG
jgi:DNA topoisomerase VI subunit A